MWVLVKVAREDYVAFYSLLRLRCLLIEAAWLTFDACRYIHKQLILWILFN